MCGRWLIFCASRHRLLSSLMNRMASGNTGSSLRDRLNLTLLHLLGHRINGQSPSFCAHRGCELFFCCRCLIVFISSSGWFDRCRGPLRLSVQCLSCFGRPLTDVADFLPLTFVVTEADDLFFPSPSLDTECMRDCRLQDAGAELQVCVQPTSALTWWLQLPGHLFECLGWDVQEADPTRVDAPTIFRLRQSGLVPALPGAHFRRYFRNICWLAQLKHWSQTSAATLVGPIADRG